MFSQDNNKKERAGIFPYIRVFICTKFLNLFADSEIRLNYPTKLNY